MSAVLEGIRVLDFGRYVAGPFCAALLGDLGAEVIRVEKREGSEDRWTAPVGAGGTGAGFLQMNRNKRSMTLDPLSPEGREIVQRLAATADVVVANVPLVQLRRMGLDYETLSALNPRIIVFMNSAFGSQGPLATRLGFETIAQAMSGSMHLSGEPDVPMRVAVPVVDFGSATLGTVGVLAALLERERSGRGQLVETALLHTALNLANTNLIEESLIRPGRTAQGNASWGSAPSDCFRTRDGWVFAMVVGGPLFKRWARLMGDADTWLGDERFADDQTRADHGDILNARTQQWCGERTTAEVLAEFERAGIPSGPVLTPREVLDDPDIAATGFLGAVEHPDIDAPAPVVTTPVTLSRTPGRIYRRPPTLGEHTDEILAELGYSPAEVEKLRETGTI